MPRGTRHELTGIVLRDGARVILRVNDGGEWHLKPELMVAKHLGKRVSVTGVREGFDLLFVEKITGL